MSMVVPLMNLHIKSLGASPTVAGIIGELQYSIDLPKNLPANWTLKHNSSLLVA